MSIALSKADKKAAQLLIEKGLQKEMAAHLQELVAILSAWEKSGSDIKEAYYKVYKIVTSFDKHLVQRYDGLRGSGYLLVLLGQYRDGLLNDADLQELSSTTQEMVKRFTSL
ncbi:hypothetical protein HRG84_23765 [Flavisolibacter sp. BT320]|nr:hypothetical protein [Flavisolibacter longurius]